MNRRPQVEIQFQTWGGEEFTYRTPIGYESHRSMDSASTRALVHCPGVTIEHSERSRLNGARWDRVVQKYDHCKVTLLDAKGRRHTDVLGVVSDITVEEGENNGIPDDLVTFHLSGRGQLLERSRVVWHPHLSGSKSNLGGVAWLSRNGGKPPTGRPDEVLTQIFNTFVKDEYYIQFPDGSPFFEGFVLRFQSPIPHSYNSVGFNLSGQKLSLWEAMRLYSDSPWLELFVDVDRDSLEDREAIVLRATPFDLDVWAALAEKKGSGFRFHNRERLGRQRLMTSERDIFNRFWTPGKAIHGGFDQLSTVYEETKGKVPLYDDEKIRRYGLRDFEQQSEYVQFMGRNDKLTVQQRRDYQTHFSSLSELLQYRTQQAYQWFGFDPFWQGQIPMQGRIGEDPEVGMRIGSVLTREDDGWQFYVTGIHQQWEMGQFWETTVDVERGHDPQEYRDWWREKTEAGTLLPAIANSVGVA